MAKVLVISDTHLKSKMFDLADDIIKNNHIDYCVQLGDNIDDFYSFEPDYEKHLKRIIQFNKKHKVIWLWGNHELHAIFDSPVTGNIYCSKSYANALKELNPKIVHEDEKVLFSHAGIFDEFSKMSVEQLNELNIDELIYHNSPIWARPSCRNYRVLGFRDKIQVVGHTPTKEITELEVDGCKIISTDVFSTNWGEKFGEEKMIIIDTNTGEYEKININFDDYKGEI